MDERNRTFMSLFVWDNVSARINMRGHAYILPLAECVELRTALDDAIEHIKIIAAQPAHSADASPTERIQSEHSDGSRG